MQARATPRGSTSNRISHITHTPCVYFFNRQAHTGAELPARPCRPPDMPPRPCQTAVTHVIFFSLYAQGAPRKIRPALHFICQTLEIRTHTGTVTHHHHHHHTKRKKNNKTKGACSQKKNTCLNQDTIRAHREYTACLPPAFASGWAQSLHFLGASVQADH